MKPGGSRPARLRLRTRSIGLWKLGEVAERGRGAEDLGAVGCEQARHLGHRRHHHVGRGLVAGDWGAEGDEELLDPRGADRREDACALRAHDIGVRDVAGGEEEVARGDVDPLVADEERELALEDVESLVLVVVNVQRGPAAARVVDLDLREGVAGLGAGDLDGDPAGLPPDIGEALARRDAVGGTAPTETARSASWPSPTKRASSSTAATWPRPQRSRMSFWPGRERRATRRCSALRCTL